MGRSCDAGAQAEREEKKRREEMELASAIDDEEAPEETVSEELCRVCW